MRLRRVEPALALFLLLWAAALHGVVFVSAGALWRDESNSIQQARMPSWSLLGRSLEYDSFPALFPSALRLWSAYPAAAGDQGLRLLGFLVGIALSASIFLTGRMLDIEWPMIALALLAMNPIWISEGDSIRPYGLGLIFLLYAFAFAGKTLANPSRLNLALTTLMSVLAVQTSYIHSLSIAAICLGAAFTGMGRGGGRSALRFFLPGFVAALSLIPYAGVLQRAREWAVVVNRQVSWPQFLDALLRAGSRPVQALWLGMLLLSAWSLVAPAAKRAEADDGRRRVTPLAYSLSVFVLVCAIQIVFIKAAGLPPFPRYFLAVAAFGAFALESALSNRHVALRGSAAIIALMLLAGPSWSWARMRHTNVDDVAAALAFHAAPQDLAVISPWFLSPSFQRYYRGPCEWITVPDIDRYPMMRYDLIQRAMFANGAGIALGERLRRTLEQGGTVWFVSQRPWTDLARDDAPEAPAAPTAPTGVDYERFRSYWERDIEYRLNACCVPEKIILPRRGPVWDEEDLMLTCWRRRPR